MPFEPRILRLIERIYEADGTNPWQGRLEALAELFGASNVVLMHHEPRTPGGAITETTTLTPEFVKSYGSYFAAVDPFAAAVKRCGWTAGSVFTGESILSFPEYQRTEFWADFARRHDADHILISPLLNNESFVSVLSIQHSHRAGPFTPRHEQWLQSLVPHLVRLLTLEKKIAALQAERDSAVGALDACSNAAVVIDRTGRVAFVNRAAEEIVNRKDGLYLTPRALTALDAAESRTLADLIRRAAGGNDGVLGRADGCMKVSRTSTGSPLVVTVARLRGREVVRPDSSGSAVVVFIHDPERRGTLTLRALQAAYELTPAEARVAADLARGLTVRASAERRGVAESTLRWHLHHVLEKTGTTTQAQLVRLLSC